MTLDNIRGMHIVRDVAAFAGTVACAIIFHWQARDLIWGLWASSLCVGYSFIVVTIVCGAWRARGTVPVPLTAGAALFFLAFFTVHFGMFHFVHSVFLDGFFPLRPERPHGFPNIFDTLGTALGHYWPVVLATFLSRWHDFQEAATATGEFVKGDMFMKPYANVIRMHILIFVFAGLAAAHATHLAVYPVLAFYFCPWRVLFPRAPASE